MAREPWIVRLIRRPSCSQRVIWSQVMVEPLLHLVVPFIALIAVRVSIRKAAFVAFIALTPDLDILFGVHRSPTHSVIVLGLLLLGSVVVTWKRKPLRTLTLFATFAISTHLLLDFFSASAPIMWPLMNQSAWIDPDFRLQIEPSAWSPASWLDVPLLTAEGTAISIILVAPTILQILRKRFVH